MVCCKPIDSNGIMHVSPWRIRSPSEERQPVTPMSVAIFAFRHVDSDQEISHEAACASPTDAEHVPRCVCCCEHDSNPIPNKDNELPVEALYEDVSWVELDDQLPMTESSVHSLKNSIGSLRKASLRMVLSRLATNPKQVRAELKQWLGDQASKLDCKVGLIEVFTGRARLSEVYENETGKASIRLGLQYGQDFTKLHDRRCLLLLIALCRPEHVWFSFPCKPWGPWTRLNMKKGEKILRRS